MMRRYPTRDEIIEQEDDRRWLKEVTKETQPMSDTLPEREDIYDMDREHMKFQEKVARALVYTGAKEVTLPAKEDQKTWLECCQGYSHAPWCSEYKEPVASAPDIECQFCDFRGTFTEGAEHRRVTMHLIRTVAVGDLRRSQSEHQPAARGGGDGCSHSSKTWHVHQNGTDVACNHDYIAIATTRKHAAQIVREHNQHQALVAALRQVPMLIEAAKGVINAHSHRGRKGYQQALTQGVNELSAALLPLIAVQETIYTALNEQRSTSE